MQLNRIELKLKRAALHYNYNYRVLRLAATGFSFSLQTLHELCCGESLLFHED
jgi:hypothetical protein